MNNFKMIDHFIKKEIFKMKGINLKIIRINFIIKDKITLIIGHLLKEIKDFKIIITKDKIISIILKTAKIIIRNNIKTIIIIIKNQEVLIDMKIKELLIEMKPKEVPIDMKIKEIIINRIIREINSKINNIIPTLILEIIKIIKTKIDKEINFKTKILIKTFKILTI